VNKSQILHLATTLPNCNLSNPHNSTPSNHPALKTMSSEETSFYEREKERLVKEIGKVKRQNYLSSLHLHFHPIHPVKFLLRPCSIISESRRVSNVICRLSPCVSTDSRRDQSHPKQHHPIARGHDRTRSRQGDGRDQHVDAPARGRYRQSQRAYRGGRCIYRSRCRWWKRGIGV
jgi:hypothetical protein